MLNRVRLRLTYGNVMSAIAAFGTRRPGLALSQGTGDNRLTGRWRRYPPGRRRRFGCELAQTLAMASQMALLCPSGMDVWMQRELTGCTDLDRFDSTVENRTEERIEHGQAG